ncbi:hypothetical protein OKW21_005446 [Catalinimonas alkaloidigena]|uniref:hypothetical protein n=1 Tax=Catalinimonas alkaloidigena TaxID=1075417 RepID=UPI0024052AC7|nr:hypothetical protein [Catalinimonas alkaloidigena]MDF9800183.1 hypothetical protein [Catalinimonas alkaloidigena]
MERRLFLRQVGSTACILPLWTNPLSSNFSSASSANTTDELLKKFVKNYDEYISRILKMQENDPSHLWFGGVKNNYGIHNPQQTAGFFQTLGCGYVSEDSKYYHDEALIQPLIRASEYMLKAQHPDGTIDLHSTNFHSTPDTAFTVEPVSLGYTLLEQDASTATQPVRDNLKIYLERAGKALSVGGIHTPNHRWVVCMALARIHHLFPDPLYVERADEWLKENIDIDEDGQYTEQSTLIYSPVVNKSLITVARLMDKPELLEPVRKNLEMTLYYLHANGEVVSEGSGRQDKYQRGTVERYYYPYRYMALHDQDSQFAAMAGYLEEYETDAISNALAYLLEAPELKKTLPQASALPTNYLKIFNGSDLVRIRRGERDATILAKNPIFFTFFKNNAALEGIRLASAFFGKGQFEGESLEREGDEFVLRQWLEGPYYQPFAEDQLPTTDGDWEKLPRDERTQSEVQKFLSEIRIRETNTGFMLDISVTGTDRVPVALEMAFRKGSKLSGVTKVEDTEEAYLLEDGYATLKEGDSEIRFGPGKAEHRWTQLRGALPKLEGQCVYITGITPFEHQIEIS